MTFLSLPPPLYGTMHTGKSGYSDDDDGDDDDDKKDAGMNAFCMMKTLNLVKMMAMMRKTPMMKMQQASFTFVCFWPLN